MVDFNYGSEVTQRILRGETSLVDLDRLLAEARETLSSRECALSGLNPEADSPLSISLREHRSVGEDSHGKSTGEHVLYTAYLEKRRVNGTGAGCFVYEGRYMDKETVNGFAQGLIAFLGKKGYRCIWRNDLN